MSAIGEGAPASIRVELAVAGRTSLQPGAGAPTYRMSSARAWVKSSEGCTTILGAAGIGARVDHAAREARVEVPAAAPATARAELENVMTMVSGVLLALQGRALVHAAAVVDRDGAAWLLPGDSRSGKSTTAAALAAAGWGYLSDDQVVLRSADGNVEVEGWLRAFRLDTGWASGTASGRRVPCDPADFSAGPHVDRARVEGLLFPRLEPDVATRVEPIGSGTALGLLLRQSPWLLDARERADRVFRLLTETARKPAFRLRLGRDVYGRPERLVERLATAGVGE
ncbi:MAG: hypothetical protein R3266_05335 [Gemmatimonadota bacterium]|nr:hypothetical protein [Gemmatimonadota bacterium]